MSSFQVIPEWVGCAALRKVSGGYRPAKRPEVFLSLSLSAGLSQAQPVVLFLAGSSYPGPHELYSQSGASCNHVYSLFHFRRPHCTG